MSLTKWMTKYLNVLFCRKARTVLAGEWLHKLFGFTQLKLGDVVHSAARRLKSDPCPFSASSLRFVFWGDQTMFLCIGSHKQASSKRSLPLRFCYSG